MKKIIKILTVFVIFSIPLKSQEADLLSGYEELLKSTTTAPPSSVGAAIDRTQDGVIKDKYEWLVFVFINGVNDLGILNLSVNDINEMETVGSTDKVAVVAEHNRIEGKPGRTLGFSNGAVTYFITKDRPNNREIVSKVIDQTPDGDMGSYIHFARSAKKAIKRFNPDKVMIIIWNHGNGYFGIAYDDVSGNSITVPQLKSALSDIVKSYGKKIDIFAMDACLMQMAEVVAEIKDYARYVVASEEAIPGGGFPYDDLLGCLNSSSDPKKVSACTVDVYHKAYDSQRITMFGRYDDKSTTLSAVDTSKFSGFLDIFNRWISQAIRSEDFKKITDKKVTENAFFFLGGVQNETVQMGAPSITTESEGVMTRTADLVSYLIKAKSEMKDERLKDFTDRLINYVTKELIVSHKGGDYQNAKGLSYKDSTYGLAIYLPLLRYDSKRYEALRFSKISLWSQFVKKMLSKENISDRAFDDSVSSHESADEEIAGEEESKADESLSSETKATAKLTSPQKNSGSFYNPDTSIPKASVSSMGRIDGGAGVVKISETIAAKPSVYSTTYTSNKTLKPTLETLTGKSKEQNEEKISDKKQAVEEGGLLKTAISKTKDGIKDMAKTISEKTKDIIETVFPDKEKRKNYEDKLREFEVEISSNISLVYSQKLVENAELKKEFLKIDSAKTAKLLSYANEIIELDKIISRNYEPKDLNSLSKTLEANLDKSRLICELGICIPPERLTEWMAKTSKYQPINVSNAELAIRKWDKIFTDPVQFTQWAQVGFVQFSSTSWSNMSIKERNAALDRIIKDEIKSGTTQSALISLSDTRSLQTQKHEELSLAVDKVGQRMIDLKVLNAEELNAIKTKPLSEQMYILSNLFDRGGIRTDSQVAPYVNAINANRSSFTNEVLDQSKRTVISAYVSSNAKAEVSKSQTGKALYSEVYGNKKPSISFEYLEGVESKNQNGKIIIDAGLVEQFLRIKGYSSEDLIKNDKAKSELLSYVSPIIVREMASIGISSKLGSGYSSQTREQYAASLLYQAKFTKERSSDESFKSLFDGFSGLNDYADKVMVVMRNYEKADNADDFVQSAGIKYYPNMPSAKTAKSEILLAVTKELERRELLDKKEKENVDKYAIFGLSDIYRLSPYEITNYVKDIKTEALIKLKTDLMSDNNFASKLDKIISRLN
ncbi:MAG: clostripain-related cysteine peptidase [Elusimicrobiota bacterium]